MSNYNKYPESKIIIDLDGTLTEEEEHLTYKEKRPNVSVVEKLKEYHSEGYKIVIYTARNMRTFSGNIGEINVHTLPIVIEWLRRHEIPFDEIIVGKPWCGPGGFYVDDRAVRPSEFAKLSYDEISALISDKAWQ